MKKLIAALFLATLTASHAGGIGEPTVNLVSDINYQFLTADDTALDYRAVFSANDAQILFEHNIIGQGAPKLYLMRIANRKLVPLLPDSFNYSSSRAAWSDQNKITFTAENKVGEQSFFTLWICKPDGTGLTPVTSPSFSTNVEYPHWYPDGETIALADYGATETLKRVKLDSKNFAKPPVVTSLTNPATLLVGEPSVSPNGKFIALAAQTPDGPYDQNNNSIYMYNTANGIITLFDDQQGRAPSWSPDGKWVTFESNRGSPNGNYAIFAKPFPDADVLYQLTPYSLNAQHAAWSHGGQLLIFSADLNPNEAGNGARGIVMIRVPLSLMH